MRGLFVTGTGTSVGKTVVAAVIARELADAGDRVAVFKPAVSGLDEIEPGGADHEILREASGSGQADEEIAPHRYGPPVSPHLAAEIVGTAIQPAAVVAAARSAADGADVLIAEGVGGLMVPLTLGYLVRDFARELALPLIVAAAPGLGTINHTLLTLEAARAVGLEVRAVVLTPWPDRPERIHESNREAIGRLGAVQVLTLLELDLGEREGWPTLGVGTAL
jgi:dethiobiotin synthetase